MNLTLFLLATLALNITPGPDMLYVIARSLGQGTRAGVVSALGIGVGTLVLLANLVLLTCYTFSCHSLRHIVGGFRDRLAGAPTRRRLYDCVSCINRRHMVFAWCSLSSVGFADLYVRLCSMGVWTDWRII